VPEVLRELPKALHNIFESPITVGAFCAILLNIFLPEEYQEPELTEFDPEAATLKVLQDPPPSPAAGPDAEPLPARGVAHLNRQDV
jgi:xanthine permease XanP